jgi:two-component system, NarL family, sensor histidine kinase UhpB
VGRHLALGFPKQLDVEVIPHLAGAEAPTAEEIQRHIAREIHDQVAQPLIGLMLEIRELKAAQPALTEELGRVEESARSILRQTREMMVDLRERGELRINLSQALRKEVPVPPGHFLSLRVTTRWPKHVNGWAAFNLLRIVQQAAANAWRHGRASKVDVILDVGPAGDALVVVLDDGIGIEDAPFGFGLAGMQERAAILGGHLTAKPRDTGGTRIEVRFPRGRLS